MYCPPAFRENREDVLIEAIEAHPLATLITHGEEGLKANVVPVTVMQGADGPVIRFHLAKANDQIGDLRAGRAVLLQFHGPHAYVSPNWYPTKQRDGKAVPTWDYIIVQASGVPAVHPDPEWLRKQLTALTDRHEGGRETPWTLGDAPPDYVAAQLKGIVGVEVVVEKIEGKWKLNQNHPMENRLGLADGLAADGEPVLAAAVRATIG
ncbi:FMN-binding negative transcriptional regulator [Sphingomonas xanthus]|uniref:FMN-binding negative transcriptional regulator n=1 Tax=Sphingomonas xanthus TaxID=2594473 RepID=A0A516IQ28_9SPHN|nr:FMN-binding negative transcriptional regulator [Sphingomonas xanthus]QDP19015.1 FMN-binding negative transcriptional regulator [Sphingomonas xanthus]